MSKDSFLKYNPDPRCNIVLFGPSGVGKSSLINSLYSPDIPQHLAKVRDGDKVQQCTISYKKYKFNKVNIFDTWGWNPSENYTANEFRFILEGKVKPKTKEKEFQVSNEPGEIIDCCIFVQSARRLSMEKQIKELKLFTPFIKIAVNKNLPIFFIVTKLDIFFNAVEKKNVLMMDLKAAIKCITKSDTWKTLRTKVKNSIGIRNLKIIPMINYDEQDTSGDDVIQKLTKDFMRAAIIEIERYKQNESDYNNISEEESFIFQNEKKRKLIFKSLNAKNIRLEALSSLQSYKNDHKFICSNIYFKFIQIGKLNFRLFIVHSLLNSKCSIIGIFCPLESYMENGKFLYFETVLQKKNVVNEIEKGLSEKYHPFYEFTDDRNQGSSNGYNKDLKRLHLSFNNFKLNLVLEKREFTKFHAMIEHSIQLIKRSENILIMMDQKMKKMEKLFQFQNELAEKKMKEMSELFEKEKLKMKELFALEKEKMNDAIKNSNQKVKGDVAKLMKTVYEVSRVFKESKIITKKKMEDDLITLTGYKNWNLIYQGSRDSFAASSFHSKCNNVPQTLVVIESTTGFIFGGYNHQGWKGGSRWVNQNNTYLFSLRGNNEINVKFPVTNTSYATYDNDNYLPSFGSNHDLHISGGCNQNNSSYTILGGSYNAKGKGANFLNGGTKNFMVKEIEIYKQ